jgi:hypothetical protein
MLLRWEDGKIKVNFSVVDEDEFMPRSRSVVAWGLLTEIAIKRLKSVPHAGPFLGSRLLGYIWMVLSNTRKGK